MERSKSIKAVVIPIQAVYQPVVQPAQVKPTSFVADYIEYKQETEAHAIYHRWSILSCIGAAAGRNFYLQFGASRIYPNIYVMLIGEPGARKSSAIKDAKRIFRSSGYDNFSADKTRLEKFLLDLEGVVSDDDDGKGRLDRAIDLDATTLDNLWGNSGRTDPREVFIAADEWTDFAPRGDTDFYSLLGNLWDWDDEAPFTHRLKNSRSVAIYQPTVSILGGITPEKFANVFPNEVIGGGFLSRLILIHGVRSGRKFTIPPEPSAARTTEFRAALTTFRANPVPHSAVVVPGAYKILDTIYHGEEGLDDARFRGYNNRRFTQLLKVCLIVAISMQIGEINEEVVIAANTYLTAAELKMPEALGEFGKSKNSDVANKIMEILGKATKPLSAKELWTYIHSDLEKITMMGDIMHGLQVAGRVQNITGRGWLPLKKAAKERSFVDWTLLTEEERRML